MDVLLFIEKLIIFFIYGILAVIAQFFETMFTDIGTNVSTVLTNWAAAISSYGPYAPIFVVISLAMMLVGIYMILEAVDMVQDFV